MQRTTHFERVAQTVTERVAELLNAAARVTDTERQVVASSDQYGAGGRDQAQEPLSPYVRVPLRVDQQAGEVIVDAPHNGEQISPRLARALVELIVNQTTALERSGQHNQHRLKNAFIHDLLHGQITDEAAILREAKLLGMDFTPPRAVMLIDAAQYILAAEPGREASDDQIRRRAQLVISSIVSFFHLPNDTICAYIGDGNVAVLKASNTQSLQTWADSDDSRDQISASWANLAALKRASSQLLQHLRADTGVALSMGIGRYHPGISGPARSYNDARAALMLGRRFHGQNGVHCLDQLGMAAFVGVADEQTKIDLATYLLSPLDHEPELLDTLHVFFADNCCPSTTARRLSIHRNTLSYRLQKIASLTGLDPRTFDAAVQIRLALLLRSMRSATH